MPDQSPKARVRAVLESIETGDPSAFQYIHPTRYRQHNLMLPDGVEGIAGVLRSQPPGSFKARVVRVYQDDDHVFAHTEYDFFGPKVGFDIFRFEDDLIVEHWDNLRPTLPPNRSGRTATDGPVHSIDVRRTESSRRIAREFVEQNWLHRRNTYTNFIRDDRYVQHNPAGADGLSSFLDTLAQLESDGVTLRFSRVHKVLAEGEFALVVSEGVYGADGGVPTAFYDLFHIQDGFITEHWDVIEPIAPVHEHRHGNGKF
ncbi:MAG: hypothetical protein J0H69_18310 [Burkholderiales bacterium]|nr:hypothetical protein [Burkholderiales bacterium]